VNRQPLVPATVGESPAAREFAESLRRALELAARLEELLLAEGGALEARDASRLHEIVVAKRPLVAALEHETQQQRALVEAAGHRFDPLGIEVFFYALPATPAIAESWRQLRQIARHCAEMNRANADLIERGRERVAAALHLLRGSDATAATYTNKGQTDFGAARNRISSEA